VKLKPDPLTDQTGQEETQATKNSGSHRDSMQIDVDPPRDESEIGWTTVRNQKKISHAQLSENEAQISKSKLKKQDKKKNLVCPAEFHFDTRGFRHGKMIQLKVGPALLSERQNFLIGKTKKNVMIFDRGRFYSLIQTTTTKSPITSGR
jgi:hypothetical protein